MKTESNILRGLTMVWQNVIKTAFTSSKFNCFLSDFTDKTKQYLPEDDQSILIETSSCNLRFFLELITTQLRISHGVTTK